ncbi:MAG: hypothetical protein L0Z62_19465 [Gemmataceae bacterium]|nr:hypothetical protein [Gemmataceae bacterium]
MAKRKAAAADEQPSAQAPADDPSAPAVDPVPPAAAASTAAPPPQDPVLAPPTGAGRAYTIDNRLGYRKEDSPDGRRRQIRFAARPDGQKPDDQMLAPVRAKKADVSWRDRAWQARKTPEGFDALDMADQELADLGRLRTGGSRER